MMERSGIRERSREWDDTWTEAARRTTPTGPRERRGQAAAAAAAAKARTDADGGGTRSFVEGWKARVSAHITWPMAIAAADAAERTPRSPSQPRGSDRKIAEKRIKGGDDIGTNAVRFIRRRNRYTPFV